MLIKGIHLKSCQGELVEPAPFSTRTRLRQAQADTVLFKANYLT